MVEGTKYCRVHENLEPATTAFNALIEAIIGRQFIGRKAAS